MPFVDEQKTHRVLLQLLAMVGLGLVVGFVAAGLTPRRPR
jgi:hypothetical protein